jgi:hypothetical protein
MSDDLVRRLACPYPKDEDVEEVTLPVWVILLTTEAADRIEELEGQLKTVLDRETSILRYYDAKLDAADAQLKTAVWALTDIGDGEPEWPDEPQRELDWCRDRANRTIAKIKGKQP